MRSFTDNANRAWNVDVNVATIKRVRSRCGVNIYDILNRETLDRLSSDPVAIADVLYVLCEPQAQAANVSDEMFGQSLAGDAFERAQDSLIHAIIDFFPPARRHTMNQLWSKTREIEASALQKADERIEALTLESLNASSGNSPESSALTPTD